MKILLLLALVLGLAAFLYQVASYLLNLKNKKNGTNYITTAY